jgi:elongator complex protein 3
MKQAEKIAKNNGYVEMAIISGVGARGYYRKFGYKLKRSYMIKSLT